MCSGPYLSTEPGRKDESEVRSQVVGAGVMVKIAIAEKPYWEMEFPEAQPVILRAWGLGETDLHLNPSYTTFKNV